jgi:hypothetical protein
MLRQLDFLAGSALMAAARLQAQHDVVAVEEAPPSSDSFGHDDARPRDKTQRRLAQNREAARKSRLRKKVRTTIHHPK